MYRKIGLFTFSNRKHLQHQLVNQPRILIQNTHAKLKECEEYIIKLFESDKEIVVKEEENKDRPAILKSEIQHTIKQLKINRSPGLDEVYPETRKTCKRR